MLAQARADAARGGVPRPRARAQWTNVQGRCAAKVVRLFLLRRGIFVTIGNFSLCLCISSMWSRLHAEAGSCAVLMIWMEPGCARWRPAISAYILPTALLMVTSRNSLYMLWVLVRLW